MKSDLILWGMLLSALAVGVMLGWAGRQYKLNAARRAWPARWNLFARPLFSVHERTLYRELRAALPQHVVLAKVSLLRFCQSADSTDARMWYARLQPLHVSLVVCTPQGVVISAIDIVNRPDRQGSRSQRLKEAVLETCRVRYLRCLPGQWPQTSLLSQWALGQALNEANDGRAQATRDALHDAGDELARTLRQRREERAQRWGESRFAQDSFFASDSRLDAAANSMPAPLDGADLSSELPAASPRAQGSL
jgi:hypothetical protein